MIACKDLKLRVIFLKKMWVQVCAASAAKTVIIFLLGKRYCAYSLRRKCGEKSCGNTSMPECGANHLATLKLYSKCCL